MGIKKKLKKTFTVEEANFLNGIEFCGNNCIDCIEVLTIHRVVDRNANTCSVKSLLKKMK